MPNPARVLIPQNQADSPASSLIQVHTVTKTCHHLVAAKIPLFLAIIENLHITSGFWGASTHVWHSLMPLPIFFSIPQIQTWISHSGLKLDVFIPFLGKYHRPVLGRCCQTCTPRSWVGDWDPGSWHAKGLF